MQISKSDLARLNKAKAAMKRAEYAPHASRGLRDARKLLKPLVEKSIAEAQYLQVLLHLPMSSSRMQHLRSGNTNCFIRSLNQGTHRRNLHWVRRTIEVGI
jgi:hypothetical protein